MAREKAQVLTPLRVAKDERVRTVSSCADVGGPFSVERSFGTEWCGSCGYPVSEHSKSFR